MSSPASDTSGLRKLGPWLLALGLISIGAGISLDFLADYAVIRKRSHVAEATADLRRLEAVRELATSATEIDSLAREVSNARQTLESARSDEARRIEGRAGLWRWNGASTIVTAAGVFLVVGAVLLLRRKSAPAREMSNEP